MLIDDVICVPVRSGFFADDQAAIRLDPRQDGFNYSAQSVTPGFTQVRVPGQAASILLLLDDGQVAHGDGATVQYAGVGGRDAPLSGTEMAQLVMTHVAPRLKGLKIGGFKELAEEMDSLVVEGRPLHSAVRYGVTQALLDAVAKDARVTMAEVVRDEYATGSALVPVPVFVQSGDDRHNNVDKMILKGVDVLPHGLINNGATKFGRDGEIFAEYVAWVRDRIERLRPDEAYMPTLHFDLYGTLGAAMDADIARMTSYILRVEHVAAPLQLRLEHPVDAGSRDGQIEALSKLKSALQSAGSTVEIAVDEWCNTLEDIKLFASAQAADVIHVKTPDLGGVNNTVEALLVVRAHGLAAYCGGTCNETERSAQVCAHIAMACEADQILARPGMGVDEGLMIVGNEMARAAALAATRRLPAGAGTR